MAFHGDFSSFALPDLLQWLDGSRKTGTLQLAWDGGERKLFLLSGQIIGTASRGNWERLARLLELGALAPGDRVMAALRSLSAAGDMHEAAGEAFTAQGIDPQLAYSLAAEELTGVMADLTSAQEGQFHWTEDTDRSDDEWTVSDVSIREMLFESLRWIDEQPDVERGLSNDAVMLKSVGPADSSMLVLHRIILKLCAEGMPLGRLRMNLGISRAAAQRRVFDLVVAGRLKIEGAPDLHSDPVAEILEKGSTLLKERQFDSAAMVFTNLLASDPTDRRVREFARMVEREHTAALYEELPPIWVPQLANDPAQLSVLKPDERHVASLINGSWDVSTIVLASQTRELETLKALARLRRMNLIQGG